MKKVLLIIPAYNEEKNIRKVLNEVKKEITYADIIVINDGSEDNTSKIVRDENVRCIDMPFNSGYSNAVQTGIKYANENNYDYVIQFDADGQHIAKEAKKLYEHIRKTNCDIVIGSRYLKDLKYPCPFFRKIGTKIFKILVRIFTRKKITDPLSGFQCFNKNVIKEYSKISGYPEYPDANLIIEMLIKGYKIEEVSSKMRIRKHGKSMHSGIIKPIKYMVQMVYTIVFIMIKNIGKRRGTK
jgi:glycosyltransferase involved in cell wall biosynthesis